MKKNAWIGGLTGAIAGGVGALLMSEYEFSLFTVTIIGIVVGVVIAFLFNLKK